MSEEKPVEANNSVKTTEAVSVKQKSADDTTSKQESTNNVEANNTNETENKNQTETGVESKNNIKKIDDQESSKKRGRGGSQRDRGNKRQRPERAEKIFEPCPVLFDKDGNEIPKEPRKPKRKVAMMIGYCGTGYHGMQLNPPNKTIEGELFDAFIKAEAISKANSTDLKKNAFMRAARTDKGVHAAGNVVSLKIICEDGVSGEELTEKINSFLPGQIRVWGIERTNKGFDCRKMCSSRIYEYLLPTYSLLPPKPSSVLGTKISEYKEKFPGVSREDPEGDEWWKNVNKKLLESNITQEEIDKTQRYLKENNGETENPTAAAGGEESQHLVRKIKQIENTLRRDYRISNDRLELFKEAMKTYEGHHNFHNFTIGKPFNDASAQRYMISTNISKPFVIENTEWVSIKIHGQSFMLHQIRKMIGMASLVIRTRCPLARISEAFNSTRINIPKAPALGLLLECPVYEGINPKLQKFGYNELNFNKFEEKMLEFKKKFIYDKIYAEEIKENSFHGFYGFIDNFNGEPIFDFLTAKGITQNQPAEEVKIKNDKNDAEIVE